MKNYLLIIITILTYSCKDNKVINQPKKVAVQEKSDKNNEVQGIGNLYNPEKMVVKENRIGTNTEKEDYQISLTNSDLLDTDLDNVENHSKKIAIIYHKYLMRNIKPFNFNKIIVKIEHRNTKTDTFEYSAESINQLLNSK